jgi:hypothetical protein
MTTSTLGAPAPVVGWASGRPGLVQAGDREIARQTALEARVVAEFAAARPVSVDRTQGERGPMSAERGAARAEVLRPVSEWATPGRPHHRRHHPTGLTAVTTPPLS